MNSERLRSAPPAPGRGADAAAPEPWQARRVVLFGLDAVSWDVVDRVAAAMPTLTRLRREGHAGVLRSTLPPITPVAWTSMVTGMNPGHHGIYEFVHRTEAGWRPVTRRQNRARDLDEMLERHGRRSMLVNLPVSHPGRSRAVRLQDFLSPDPEPVEPAELKDLSPDIAAYRPFYAAGAIASKSVDEMVADVCDLEDGRLRATRALMRSQPWQFLFYGVTGTDHLQHRALDQILGDAPVPANILRFYGQIDRALEFMLSQMRETDLLIVASDHGSAVMRREFLVNEWLAAEGFAQWRAAAAPAGGPKGRAGVARRLVAMAKRLAFALGLDRSTAGLRRRLGLRIRLGGGPVAEVDEARSSAYMPTAFAWPALVVPGADRADLVRRLRDLVDPATGAAVFESVLTADDAYSDGRVAGAPDIVLMPSPGMSVHPGRGGVVFRDVLKNHHKRDGIVLLYGGRRLPLPRDLGVRTIEDVAPTVLAAMGFEVPEGLDGRPILPVRQADTARRAVRAALRGLAAAGSGRQRQEGV